MLLISIVSADFALIWKIHGKPGWEVVAFPNVLSHGGKHLPVLVNIRSLLVFQVMVGDVVCGFRTWCELSDASLRTCWFQLAEERASFDVFSFSEKCRVSWTVSTENAIAYSEGGKARSSWDGSRLIFFPLEKLIMLPVLLQKMAQF